MMAQDAGQDSRKAEFLRRAAGAYDRMMKEDQEQMITFEQMEDRALEVGGKLEHWLLEQRLAGAVKRKAAQQASCPKCGRPLDMGPPEERAVQGRVGKVLLDRPIGYCPSCRKGFSPCGRATEA
jgi:uncharacterized protein with PIN domain